MNARLTFKIRTAATLLLSAGLLASVSNLSVGTPTSTAQVGVPYNSGCTPSGGVSPYTVTISAGSIPNNLNLNNSTGAITGTPTVAGVFNFTCRVVDSQEAPATQNGPADANRKVIAKSGSSATTTLGSFSITVAPAASPTPVPPSIWMAAMGLAGAGLLGRRKLGRA